MTELDARGRRLRAALAPVLIKADAPELRLVHRWLDTWNGIGLIAAGMYHQGVRLALTHVTEGEWRAAFTADAMLAPAGYGVAAAPWRAVQMAAWATLTKEEGR